MKKTTSASKPKKKPVSAKTTKEKGYMGHVAGSRKGKVHELFDKQGPEAGWTLGLKLGLKEGKLRSWFGTWTRETMATKKTKTA